MIKNYIMNMSLQGKDKLNKGMYEAVNLKLGNTIETRFPLVPIIVEEASYADEIRIIVVQADNSDADYNTNLLRQELSENNLDANVCVIKVSEIKQNSDYVKILFEIIREISDYGTMSIDVTYGTKPESLIIYYAAMIAENIKPEQTLAGIYYGQVVRNQAKEMGRYLHKLNIIKTMFEMTDSLKGLGYDNMEDFINILMSDSQ